MQTYTRTHPRTPTPIQTYTRTHAPTHTPTGLMKYRCPYLFSTPSAFRYDYPLNIHALSLHVDGVPLQKSQPLAAMQASADPFVLNMPSPSPSLGIQVAN
uniref:Uncharacterized protein n=1 Tax=Eutreptiella gymnastica TaxID=73025 RepID=A0A7S1J5U2_9EUGL|mmetsp:Transcript_69521/g.122715  ORF Transcript_69521/g.122715 Transcript_69521/m.122715 type:complete len:100 (+) Transcript_69521:369-668(+)